MNHTDHFHAGSKRPCPSGMNMNQGDYGDGNPASQLSLLARCALNRGEDNPAHSQNLWGGQNHGFQLPSTDLVGGAAVARKPYQHSTDNGNMIQLPAAQHAQNLQHNHNNLAAQSITQNANPFINHMACMQPNTMLAQGQSQPTAMMSPQYLASMQAHQTGASDASLRPFGMTPQELLNYA